LALPVAAGHVGNQLMSVVDAAMVGRLGAASLAGVGIGNGIYFTFTVFGAGCVVGMDTLVSQALGAGEEAKARRILWQGLRVALVLGVPLMLLIAAAPLALPGVGVDPRIVHEVRRYVLSRLPNVLPFLVFAALRAYLQAHLTTRPIVVAVIVANVMNVVGNALFIYGDAALTRFGLPGIGLPALGVVGAGLSSSLAAISSVTILAVATRQIAAPPDPDRRRLDLESIRRMLRLGVPVGLQTVAEVGAFACVGVMAGRLGPLAAAGHQIALTLASLTFTVAFGIGAATAVRVGRQVGAGDTPGARRAGFVGMTVAVVFMAGAAVLFLSIPRALAHALSDDPTVIAAALPLLHIAALFQLTDGAQVSAAGALRGAGDTRGPLYANVVGYYALALPAAVFLGFQRHLGAPGLWWGLSLGVGFVALGLIGRFLSVSAGPIVRA
jgi:MATE family multidrug resistance protein